MSQPAMKTSERISSEHADSGRSHQRYELLADLFHNKGLPNAMTVDVEEYFQVSAFDPVISRSAWPDIPSRLSLAMDRILGLFDVHGAKATFFTLGWVLDHHPDIVKRIVREGHEIASHGYGHTRVSALGRKAFREEVQVTRRKLEDVSGTAVVGYRAPSFSIGPGTPWAHDELREAGYDYSSSVFPISHDHYGSPDAPRFPYRPSSSSVIEIPMSTLPVLGKNLPCSGGGYFRLFPVAYSKWAVRRINTREQMPVVFYCHPWEIDPDQPRVEGLPARTRFRHYLNLGRFESRLSEMLRSFEWDRMDRIFLGAA